MDNEPPSDRVRADGQYEFEHETAFGVYYYSGRYLAGLREGLWRVLNPDGDRAWEITWRSGVWDGPATTWWNSGGITHQGQHVMGERSGTWSFWFEHGQLAATGKYLSDRKIGTWTYYDEDGHEMNYPEWKQEFSEWDWAYDDYAGFPRGENWPHPPAGAPPIGEIEVIERTNNLDFSIDRGLSN